MYELFEGGLLPSNAQEWLDYYSSNNFGIGIECIQCGKWRLSLQYTESDDIPDGWNCSMWKIGDKYGNCDIAALHAQENFSPEKYSPGSLVWGKMGSALWCPGMVDECPDELLYFKKKAEHNLSEDEYNITFFNDVPHRRWLKDSRVVPFKKPPEGALNFPKKYRTKLTEAHRKAEEALSMSIQDRLKMYSFTVRYQGKDQKLSKKNLSGKFKLTLPGSVARPAKTGINSLQTTLSGSKKQKVEAVPLSLSGSKKQKVEAIPLTLSGSKKQIVEAIPLTLSGSKKQKVEAIPLTLSGSKKQKVEAIPLNISCENVEDEDSNAKKEIENKVVSEGQPSTFTSSACHSSDNYVYEDEVTDNSVNEDEVAHNSVNEDVTDNSVDEDEVTDNSVNEDEVTDNSVNEEDMLMKMKLPYKNLNFEDYYSAAVGKKRDDKNYLDRQFDELFGQSDDDESSLDRQFEELLGYPKQKPAKKRLPPAEKRLPPAKKRLPPAKEGQPPAKEGQPPAKEGQPPAKEGQPPAKEGQSIKSTFVKKVKDKSTLSTQANTKCPFDLECEKMFGKELCDLWDDIGREMCNSKKPPVKPDWQRTFLEDLPRFKSIVKPPFDPKKYYSDTWYGPKMVYKTYAPGEYPPKIWQPCHLEQRKKEERERKEKEEKEREKEGLSFQSYHIKKP